MTEPSRLGADQPSQDGARARITHRAMIVAGGIIPVAVATVATLVMLSWLPELPDPIAVHWSGAGPDGYGPAVPFILMPLGIIVLFAATMVAATWKLPSSGRPSVSQKLVAATSVWLSAFLSIGIGASVAAQRGLADASQAPEIGLQMLVSAAFSLVLAAACWALLPAADTSTPPGISPERMPLSNTERVSWSQLVTISPRVLVLIGATVALAAGAAIVTVVASSAAAPIAIGSLLLVGLAVSGTLSWRVTADRRGLTARSLLGWPRVRIRPADIAAVRVVEVNPMADFGGWGYRWAGNGRSGVVMREGEAIEVTRSSGRRFVVTVDDAGTAASVLAALAAEPAA